MSNLNSYLAFCASSIPRQESLYKICCKPAVLEQEVAMQLNKVGQPGEDKRVHQSLLLSYNRLSKERQTM